MQYVRRTSKLIVAAATAAAVAGVMVACGGSSSGDTVTESAGTTTTTGGSSGGTLNLNIAGPSLGVTQDVLVVAGKASLGGTLALSFTDGYVPVAGQRFNVVQAAGGISGSFQTVTNDKQLVLSVSQDSNNVYVSVK